MDIQYIKNQKKYLRVIVVEITFLFLFALSALCINIINPENLNSILISVIVINTVILLLTLLKYNRYIENVFTELNKKHFLQISEKINKEINIFKKHDRYKKEVKEELKRNKENLEEFVADRTKELLVAKESFDMANGAKNKFLANMSHEIRTPMNAIMGYTQLMAHDRSLNKEQKENLGLINQSTKQLMDIINDVLEMAQIKAEKVKLSNEDFDLRIMLLNLQDLFKERIELKGLGFSLDIESKIEHLYSDRNKIHKILYNLLDNAVRCTETGAIGINAFVSGDINPILIVEVKDSGVGISGKDQKLIFKSFEQAASVSKTEGCTGLGLSISLGYAKLMEGNISLDSEVGKGSTFCFKIPVLEGIKVIEPDNSIDERKIIALEKNQDSPSVLIVDDSSNNRLLLKKNLISAGIDKLFFAENGIEAIELLENNKIKLILMDMKMPVMDGYEAISRIRENYKTDNIIIIAISGSSFDDDCKEILKTGANELLCKPIKKNELLHCVRKQLGLKFVYKEEKNIEETIAKKLTPETLLMLPFDLRSELAKASLMGEVESCMDVVSRIKGIDEPIGNSIEQLIHSFKFEKIYALSHQEK